MEWEGECECGGEGYYRLDIPMNVIYHSCEYSDLVFRIRNQSYYGRVILTLDPHWFSR